MRIREPAFPVCIRFVQWLRMKLYEKFETTIIRMTLTYYCKRYPYWRFLCCRCLTIQEWGIMKYIADDTVVRRKSKQQNTITCRDSLLICEALNNWRKWIFITTFHRGIWIYHYSIRLIDVDEWKSAQRTNVTRAGIYHQCLMPGPGDVFLAETETTRHQNWTHL